MAKVKVFSTQSCPWCTRVKDFLKENKVEFEDINVGSDRKAAMEMVSMSGQQGVPQIQIDNTIIVGFNEPAIRKELNL